MTEPVAYYNEIDPYAAEWLRNLIDAGHIAKGIVDERSIEDVKPDELVGYTQCHFFAGIGVWSLALRRAGWPDNRPVWTGSCPCQPFSSAGAGAGFDDERHLWPSFAWIIEQCRPPVVFGEQVASKAVDDWIDLVHADLEGMGYAFGAVPFPSAGVGAPHIRDRLFWVGNAYNARLEGLRRGHKTEIGRIATTGPIATASEPSGMADTEGPRPPHRGAGAIQPIAPKTDRNATARTGPTNGFWRDADWLGCRDGKWRPVEPGTFPLAHGSTARVGRLRAYGNAINAKAAEVFIESFMQEVA